MSIGIVSAFGADKQDAPRARLSGALLVCKDCLTVRGTFLMDARGKNITRLNYLFGEDITPRFSPADDRILFASTRGNTPGLWTMNRAGEEQKRLCDGDQGDWFPDGQRIAFRRAGQIMARSLDTGQETVLSPTRWTSCSRPACAPDGKRVLFVTQQGETHTMCLLTVGQSNGRQLATGEIHGAPRWSPDGKRIVYQSGPHLWTMDANGSNKRQLTATGGMQRRPAWSPDGTAIAYSQGPGPKGPWQMAAISVDGTRRFSISAEDARCVLCSDWGLEKPGQQAPAIDTTIQAPPRIRMWEIEQPAPEEPADWAAFCRAKKGWRAMPVERAFPQSVRGGCAVENESDVFLLLAGKAGAVLAAKTARRGSVGFGLLDPQGKEAGPVESIRIASCGPDQVVLESSSRSAGALVKTSWSIGGSQTLLQVTPLENAAQLRIQVPMECVVAPDRFGNDIVADPETCGERPVSLPWAPLLTALYGKGFDMLLLICPEQGQRARLRKGNGPLFADADVAFQNHTLSAGLITAERAWRLERFAKEGFADGRRLNWKMPCAAAWRLAVQGDRRCCSAFFSDKESALFDGKNAVLRKGADLPVAPRLGVIYLYGRTAKTPLDALAPTDLVRDALGIGRAELAFDEAGLTGYRKAARPTTWADLSGTVESLRYLFERQLETQDAAYARRLCDDLPPFVEGMDQRLKEYAAFARELQALTTTSAAQVREDLAPVVEKLRELGQRQRELKSSAGLPPLCTKIVQLTAKESVDNQKQFGECCKAILQIAGPREELLRACRKAAVEARDAAGIAPLTQAELVAPAEKIRALCQSVLRNRFYVEADWRGEDYNVPAFWLGPRPYQ